MNTATEGISCNITYYCFSCWSSCPSSSPYRDYFWGSGYRDEEAPWSGTSAGQKCHLQLIRGNCNLGGSGPCLAGTIDELVDNQYEYVNECPNDLQLSLHH